MRELAHPEAGRVDVRMNDGACDPEGRFWAGTMAYDESPAAREGIDGKALARQPNSGRVFAISGIGVRGLPCQSYRGRLSKAAPTK